LVAGIVPVFDEALALNSVSLRSLRFLTRQRSRDENARRETGHFSFIDLRFG
jgi:hypothetical protein